jgi:hypothetical protein
MAKRRPEEGVQRVLVTPDLHFRARGGGLDKRAWNCMLQYASAHKWDAHINLGDILDFPYISEFSRGKPGLVEGESFFRDYEYANKRLDEIAEATHNPVKPCAHYWLEGNHDERVGRYLAAHPELRGQIEVPLGLRLAERRWTWVPFWSKGLSVQIGKAMFIHGKYTNEHHAKYHVHHYNKNVFYAHVHDVSCYSRSSHGGYRRLPGSGLYTSDQTTMVGQSLGTLCELNQDYMQGRPTNWQHAFATFFFFPDGQFTYYVSLIFKGRCVGPDGRVYAA